MSIRSLREQWITTQVIEKTLLSWSAECFVQYIRFRELNMYAYSHLIILQHHQTKLAVLCQM